MTYVPPLPLRTWADNDAITATRLNANVYRSLVALHRRPACLTWLSDNVDISHATWTVVPLDLVAFDSDQMTGDEDIVGRVRIRTAGIYEIGFGVRFDFAGSGTYELAATLGINDVTRDDGNIKTWTSSAAWSYPQAQGVMHHSLQVGDSIDLRAWQSTGGGALAVLGGNADYVTSIASYCRLWLTWMGLP